MKKISSLVHALRLGALFTLVVPFFAAADNTLTNPLNSSYSTVPTFIEGALKVLVKVALPVVALFVVIAGFYFVSARGNSSKITEAKDNLLYVVLGAALILGAWVLATLISGTVDQIVK